MTACSICGKPVDMAVSGSTCATCSSASPELRPITLVVGSDATQAVGSGGDVNVESVGALGITANLARAGISGGVTLARRADADGQLTPPTERTEGPPVRADAGLGVAELLAQGDGTRKYVVAGEIARGGMGLILRAVDRDIRREVAMKVLLDETDEGSASETRRRRLRFVEEAQVTGQLEHPNIVPIHDIGVGTDGRLFFTMKMVRGRSLAHALIDLRRGNPKATSDGTLGRLLGVLVGVCNAVAFAHSRSVIHRDLKPANIMIGEYGEVLVMDWGLARVGQTRANPTPTAPGATPGGTPKVDTRAQPVLDLADEKLATIVAGFRTQAGTRISSDELNEDGTVEGTPAYMPPEQARGDLKAIDERSDVYSLGAILYEMLCFRPPVGGRDLQEVLDHVIAGRIPPPERRAPDRVMPPELSAVAMKALASNPTERYQSVIELRRDLERFLEHRAVSAKIDTPLESLFKFMQRNQGATWATAVALVILLGVLGSAFAVNLKARHKAEEERAKAENALKDARYQTRIAEIETNKATEQQKIAENATRKLTGEIAAKLDSQAKAAPALVEKARREIERRDFSDANADLDLALEYNPRLATARLLRAQLMLRDSDQNPKHFEAVKAEIDLYLRNTEDPADDKALAGQLLALCERGCMEGMSSALASALADILVKQGMNTIADDLAKSSADKVKVYRKIVNAKWPDAGNGDRFRSAGQARLELDGLRGRSEVTDLTLLQGIPLTRLLLEGTQVTDLSPLQGMPLTYLDLHNTPLPDLGPLSGMPLRFLRLSKTKVVDLTPLKGCPLVELDLSDTAIENLSPLQGMKSLRTLNLGRTKVTDLSPLTGLDLETLSLEGTPIEDVAALRDCTRLLTLNLNGTQISNIDSLDCLKLTRLYLENTRVADLTAIKGMPLREIAIRGTQVADLAPLAGMAISNLDLAGLPVNDLSPLAPRDNEKNGSRPLAFLNLSDTQITSLAQLRRLKLASLNLARTRISDLTPLAGMPLSSLDLTSAPVRDLAPLKGMPLMMLKIDQTLVEDLAPLIGMPLRDLRLGGLTVTTLEPLKNLPLKKLHFTSRPKMPGFNVLRTKPLDEIFDSRKPPGQHYHSVADFFKAYDADPANR